MEESGNLIARTKWHNYILESISYLILSKLSLHVQTQAVESAWTPWRRRDWKLGDNSVARGRRGAQTPLIGTTSLSFQFDRLVSHERVTQSSKFYCRSSTIYILYAIELRIILAEMKMWMFEWLPTAEITISFSAAKHSPLLRLVVLSSIVFTRERLQENHPSSSALLGLNLALKLHERLQPYISYFLSIQISNTKYGN